MSALWMSADRADLLAQLTTRGAPMPTSQNGYPANDQSLTCLWKVEGISWQPRLQAGSAGWLLAHFVGWYNANIERIDVGSTRDDWSYAERDIRGSEQTSNHASGTAIDLNALRHPMGVRGTLTYRWQVVKIRAVLSFRYKGCIRWGGDYSGRPDEMHYEIVRDMDTCRKVRHGMGKFGARWAPLRIGVVNPGRP